METKTYIFDISIAPILRMIMILKSLTRWRRMNLSTDNLPLYLDDRRTS